MSAISHDKLMSSSATAHTHTFYMKSMIFPYKIHLFLFLLWSWEVVVYLYLNSVSYSCICQCQLSLNFLLMLCACLAWKMDDFVIRLYLVDHLDICEFKSIYKWILVNNTQFWSISKKKLHFLLTVPYKFRQICENDQ